MHVFLPGTDIGGEITEDMPCIVCKKPVEPGKGSKAIPPYLPALHSGECLQKAAVAATEGLRKSADELSEELADAIEKAVKR